MHRTAIVVLLLGSAMPALAHEIVVRSPATAEPGDPVTFQVESTHVPGRSEEIEAIDNVVATLVEGEGRAPLTMAPNDQDLTLDGSFSLQEAGAAMLHVHRVGMVWSNTPAGWQEGGRKMHSDAAEAHRFEKFTKVLVNAAANPGFVAKPLGDPLEIVPVDDVARAKVGDVVTVQVLRDGKPAAGELDATYLGFTDVPSSYAWSTASEDGTYKVKLTAPGMWLLRAAHDAPVGDGDVDLHKMRAILQFQVQ